MKSRKQTHLSHLIYPNNKDISPLHKTKTANKIQLLGNSFEIHIFFSIDIKKKYKRACMYFF